MVKEARAKPSRQAELREKVVLDDKKKLAIEEKVNDLLARNNPIVSLQQVQVMVKNEAGLDVSR